MPPTPSRIPADRDSSNLSFEAALADLKDVVARLESGDLTLEETISTFGKGSELAAHCQKMIAEAELRVTELANDTERESQPEQSSIRLPE